MKQVKEFLSPYTEYQIFIQRMFMILQLIVLLLGLMFNKSFTFVALLLGVLAALYGFLSFCLIDVTKAQKQFKIMIWSLSFSICGFLNGYFISTWPKFPKFLMLALDFIIIITFVLLTNIGKGDDEKTEQKRIALEELLTRNLYEGDGTSAQSQDTVLGIIKETGKPNIIPAKDRYLHMLVLGVTGSGKTSQSLLPMVAKDVKCHDLGVVCLDPKGDFAEQVYALAKLEGREDVVYFNPTLENCPYFNPLVGDLDSVTECLVTTFKKLENEQRTFFANMDEMLMRRCIKVVKRLKGDDATLWDINVLMNNVEGKGKRMLDDLSRAPESDPLIQQENNEIISWFNNDYYSTLSGMRSATKTYEQCSGVRNQVSKLLANSLVKRLLCPEIPRANMNYDEYLDFDRVLEEGGILSMSSAQGELRELGSFIGYFLILSFESAVFRRPGSEDTRKGVIFYVDEFQKYANDGYADLLTQGRSYRVASVLATQTRAGIAANSGAAEGKVLIDVVSSNCRNKIVYPGCSFEDAQYYSKEFGEKKVFKEKVSLSRDKGLLGRYNTANQKESISTDEKYEPLFTPTDIMQRPFGEAVAQVIRHNTVQKPCVVKLQFIDRKLKNKMDDFIENNIRTQHINYVAEDDEPKKPLNSVANYKVDDIKDIEGLGNEGDYGDEFEL